MANEPENTMTSVRFPSAAEVAAFERAARQARAKELARLLKAAYGTVKGWVAGLAGGKAVRHA